MPDMSKNKTPMPELEPCIRNKNFNEVALGYTEEDALKEASRCLNCKNHPCTDGCPVNVKIPEFISLIANRDFEGAYLKIKETNSLPAVCGRVCPQEKQCEGKCVRSKNGESVAIGRLERFAADWHMKNGNIQISDIKPNGKKVAVVGSGPSGLACAGELAKLGYSVTVFEAFHIAGGVLSYGIPEFRLPKNIVKYEIENLKKMGVKIETDMVIGKIFSVEELMKDFSALYIASGAGLPNFMGIEGENLLGVFSANEFLTRINLMKAYLDDFDTPITKLKNVAVIGGGNVAMDAARCAKRLGAENVYIVYRRSVDEIPARAEELHHAVEEGIELKLLTNPIKIVGDENGKVSSLECIKMELGLPDESGRCRPIPIKDSEFSVSVDTVIMAIGNSPNPLIRSSCDKIKANNRGCIVVDENNATTMCGVYAGGDAVTGAATVILAMGAGKKAAAEIDRFLTK